MSFLHTLKIKPPLDRYKTYKHGTDSINHYCDSVSAKMLKKVFLLAVLALMGVSAENGEFNKCGYNIQCAEEELMKVIDELDKMKKLEVLGDAVVIQRSNGSLEKGAGRSMDVLDRVLKYVGEHELKINLPMNLEAARGLVSGESF